MPPVLRTQPALLCRIQPPPPLSPASSLPFPRCTSFCLRDTPGLCPVGSPAVTFTWNVLPSGFLRERADSFLPFRFQFSVITLTVSLAPQSLSVIILPMIPHMVHSMLCYSFSIFLVCMACGIPSSSVGIKLSPPALEMQNLNHWTAREAPCYSSCRIYVLFSICLPILEYKLYEKRTSFPLSLFYLKLLE